MLLFYSPCTACILSVIFMKFAVRNLNSQLVYPPDFVKIIVPIEYDNKQLLNEVEHDIENYQRRGLRYPQTEALTILIICENRFQ